MFRVSAHPLSAGLQTLNLRNPDRWLASMLFSTESPSDLVAPTFSKSHQSPNKNLIAWNPIHHCVGDTPSGLYITPSKTGSKSPALSKLSPPPPPQLSCNMMPDEISLKLAFLTAVFVAASYFLSRYFRGNSMVGLFPSHLRRT